MPAKRAEKVRPAQNVSQPDAAIRFEVIHNGRRVARAGMARYGILDAALTWCRRHPSRVTDHEQPELQLHVGGVDSSEPAWNRHVSWAVPAIERGDRLELRISGSRSIDAPSAETRYRVVERITPPPGGDPARADVSGAVLWRVPDGIYLDAKDRNRGGPMLLSRAEARRLADALVKAAGAPPLRTKTGETRRPGPAARRKTGRKRR